MEKGHKSKNDQAALQLVDFSTVTCWMSPFVILGVSELFCSFKYILMEILLAKNVDPYQMPLYVASDLGLQCLLMTFLRGFQVKMG